MLLYNILSFLQPYSSSKTLRLFSTLQFNLSLFLVQEKNINLKDVAINKYLALKAIQLLSYTT